MERIEFFHRSRKVWVVARRDMTWELATTYGVPCRAVNIYGGIVKEFDPKNGPDVLYDITGQRRITETAR